MNFTDLRLKIRHFFRKYKNIILLFLCIWLVVFIVNLLLARRKPDMTPSSTLEEHTSIMDNTNKVPTSMKEEIENIISDYVAACNDGNYQKAFNYLSEDCRKYEFDDNVEKFMGHVLNVTPTPKEYAIQDYSNITLPDGTDIFIYEVKYYSNFIATGLTGADYSFSSEKMTFYRSKQNSELMMNVGDYIYHSDPDSITENEYLKADIQDRRVEYKTETYQILLTNRSNYTVVISDEVEIDEVSLVLDNDANETRQMQEFDHIVLGPNESKTITVSFQKFVDDGDNSKAIVFNHVRVMDKYSGNEDELMERDPNMTEEAAKGIVDEEKNNSIAQISMNIPIVK